MDIYHKHHIIPKHMGGSNEPSNIKLLTIEEHAKAHLNLYNQYNKIEDYIAYKALSGQISISQAAKLAWIIGSYKGGYAKKPNKIPAYNRKYFHCIGCRKEDKPHNIIKYHKKCYQKYYKISATANSGQYNSEKGKQMAIKNNSLVICPNCLKQGQYRAMKRWHFDKCRLIN